MAKPESIATTLGERIGVPGIVPGMKVAAERFGTRDWADYFGPAIDAAEHGFPIYSFLYGEAAAASERLGYYPETRATWMPAGFIQPAGDLFVQKKLAETLRTLAQRGSDYFIRGGWAERFVSGVNQTGERISLEEVAGYESVWVDPVEFSYRGVDFRGDPPASLGGTLNGMVFNILEHVDLREMGHYTDSAEALDVIRKAFDLATDQTHRFVSNPKTAQVPARTLIFKELGALYAALIRESGPVGDIMPRRDALTAVGAGSARRELNTDTTHLTIVDEDGNWVSMAHTVYGDTFGTGLTVDRVFVNSGNTFPGTGASEGRRVITLFPAVMALDAAGRPWLSLGSPGLSTWAAATTK